MSVLTSNLRGVERFGELPVQAEITGPIPERGTRNASPDVLAADLAGLVLAVDLIDQQILRDDDFPFGADHLGDVGDAARTVAQTLGLYDHVDRAHDHLADGLRG